MVHVIPYCSGDKSLTVYRVQLFDVAVSLLPGLGSKEIDILFEEMKRALKVHLVLVCSITVFM